MTLPTLLVQLDDGTGTFPFDISTKVKAVEGYDISRGRDDWQGAVTAGELTNITLNNSDGRFTPGSTVLATPSPITVDQRIRLIGIVNGVTYTRFTGYVKSWPVSWPAVVTTFATVQVAATDAQARAERRTLRSMLEEEISGLSASAYYTLSEPAGSTSAGDTSGSQAPSLTIAGTGAAVSFGIGTGPGTDGLSAAQFFGGQYLAATSASNYLGSPRWSYGLWVAIASPPAGLMGLFSATDGGTNSASVWMDASGRVQTGTLASPVTGPVISDGLTHHVAVTWDGTTLILFVDGASVGTTTGSGPMNSVTVGFAVTPTSVAFTGTMSHVATYQHLLTAADVSNIYNAGHGFTESGASRITRLAGYAGIPVGALDASLTNVPSAATTGKTAFEAIQEVADAELGLTFIDGSGNLTFHNRNRVASKSAPDLTLTSQWVTPDVQPVVDDQRLINYSEVTAESTGIPRLAHNTVSETTHGRYPDSRSYLVQTDAEALDRANWIVGNFAEPTPRYGTLTISLYGMTAAQASTVLAALDINCWLRVTSLASQNPGGTTADVVVQGWRENVSPESTTNPWTITCNVVARSLYAAWILGDSTYGVLGSTTKLAV